MVPINKVDIGVARRAEENGITQSAAGSGMGRGVLLAEVGLDFHDPRGQGF
jgi:hypothetical protein